MPNEQKKFKDQSQAGKQLAEQLEKYRQQRHVAVLSLSPHALPIAAEVAQYVEAPLSLLNTKELKLPGAEQMSFGAITTGGVRVLNQARIDAYNVSQSSLEPLISREREQLEIQQQFLLDGGMLPVLSGHTVILVDDAMEAPDKMQAAVQRLRAENPQRIVVALPVADGQACKVLRSSVDEVVCLQPVDEYQTLDAYYEKVSGLRDEEAREYLRQANVHEEYSTDG
jgi:putative phosphoribosyl transferase